MSTTGDALLGFTAEEFDILAQLLESERTKLLVGIRHTDHRAFRNELRHRLDVVDGLVGRFARATVSGPESSLSGA